MLDRLETGFRLTLDWASASRWRASLLVLLVTLAVVLPGLSAMPVTDRDEARFAQASKQMLETGDLIDIRFQDEPRWKKPVGIYWLQAASAQVLGGGVDAGIWAYRIPSAVAALLAALLTVWAARPMMGERGAVLAGLMLATCLLLAGEANIAKTDAALMASAIAVLGGMAHLMLGQAGWGGALIFWLGIAIGILLKGPIVPAIAVLAFVWLWIATRAPPAFGRFRPLAGLALTTVLVAPWLVAIWIISDGAFFAESLGRDMGAKLTSGQEKHWGPPGLYSALVWLTFWPWAALLPAAAAGLWAARRQPWLRLLAGWVIPFWIILEVIPTKLPHYVLPLYPALAIAVAAWVISERRGEAPIWMRRVSAVLTLLPVVLLIGALLVLPAILQQTVVWPVLPLIAIGGWAAWQAARAALDHRVTAQVCASLIAAVALYPAVLQFGLPSLTTAFASPRIAALTRQFQPCASGPLHSIGYREPSLIFLNGTDTDITGPSTAVPALRHDPGAMVLIESRWRDILGDEFPDVVVRGQVTYFNYNRGKFETADLVTQDDLRWEPCSG
ncbi:MAG: glycosyltransferase family 39 protein [Pseudomonadota bacterium]